MDTLTIKKLLKSYNCFKGVFPCDRVPYKAKLPLNIIINTDPSNKPGTHWVCVSIDKNGRGFYFDSFGFPPNNSTNFKIHSNKDQKMDGHIIKLKFKI